MSANLKEDLFISPDGNLIKPDGPAPGRVLWGAIVRRCGVVIGVAQTEHAGVTYRRAHDEVHGRPGPREGSLRLGSVPVSALQGVRMMLSTDFVLGYVSGVAALAVALLLLMSFEK